MNLLSTLRGAFAFSLNNRIQEITFTDVAHSWIVTFQNRFGVAIEVDRSIEVNERFANMYFFTESLQVKNEEKYFLLLMSDMPKLRNEFANVCTMFLDKGEDNYKRDELILDPLKWWKSMKLLFGNRTSEKMVYSVLGEMLVYHYLLKIIPMQYVQWNGPNGGSVDIEGLDMNFEVKSTTRRYISEIEINSQYQLVTEKPTYLFYCRFEESPNGMSIIDVIDMLIKIGVKEEIIEDNLDKLGILKGSLDRQKSYKILEVIKYSIDEDFPTITPHSFKENVLPPHILKITYTVDLTGIIGETVQLLS